MILENYKFTSITNFNPIKKRQHEYTKELRKKISMTRVTTMV